MEEYVVIFTFERMRYGVTEKSNSAEEAITQAVKDVSRTGRKFTGIEAILIIKP